MSRFLDKSGLQKLWDNLKKFFVTKEEAFTKSKVGIVSASGTFTMEIGFTPKFFEFIGIDNQIAYLQWDNTNGWNGNPGPFYDYNVDTENNTVTISAHTSMGNFMWRALG